MLSRLTRMTAPLAVRRNMSTVLANTINIIFVDLEGNRAPVKARIGQRLLDVAQRFKVDIEGPCEGGGSPTEMKRTNDWTETTYGEGPTCFVCHVKIPSRFNHLLDDQTLHEKLGLEDVWEDEAGNTSRLACQIVLERKHDGLVCFVPDMPPIDVI